MHPPVRAASHCDIMNLRSGSMGHLICLARLRWKQWGLFLCGPFLIVVK